MDNTKRQIRAAIRGFLMIATIPELERELEISKERTDDFRAACVQELLDEAIAEATEAGYDKLAGGWV